MKIKKTNVYKIRWLRLIKELKDFIGKRPHSKVELEIILATMENIESTHLSRDVVSSRFILQKYPDIDKTMLHYGRKTGRLPYIKKGGTFYYKENEVISWLSTYTKHPQKKTKG